MAKTKRKAPLSQESKHARLEREWERQQAMQEGSRRAVATEGSTPLPTQPARAVIPVPGAPSEQYVTAVRAEAEEMIAAKADPGGRAFSRQNPPPGRGAAGGGLLWWSGGDVDSYIPLDKYGTRKRQQDLRAFALLAPMVLIAESVLIKKMQALQWSVESGRNRAMKWQRTLAQLEQNKGWDTFIAKWCRSYCESDYGGYAEIIRRAPAWAVTAEGKLTERGVRALQEGEDRAWAIVDGKVMDPCRCVPSADPEFPLTYYNPFTGDKHRLRPHQFMHILDMPNVDDSVPNQGACAVSRAVWAAQEDRMVTRYGFEALSENPGTGMILANVNQNLLETALESAKTERSARNAVYYKGLIFLPVLNPSGTIKLEYLSFSHLPENFNRTEDYSRIKEIVASAFGMDVLELGSIPGHNLGTSQQADVAASKARGKGIGALIQGVEREFRHKFLPSDVQLRIKKHDIDEQKDRAELDGMYFSHATSMVQVGAWDPVLANQYLADLGAIQPEYPYMAQDLTPSEELEDTEATEKRWTRDGPRVRVDREGKVEWMEKAYTAAKGIHPLPSPVLRLAALSPQVGVDDLTHAKMLWARYQPRRKYADLVR